MYIENEDVVRDFQHECEDVHQNQPLPNLRVEDAMDIPLAAPVVVGRDSEGDGNRNVSNYLMYGVMFVLGMVNLCVVKGPLAGAHDYLLANKFERTHCIDPCPLFEKMMEVFDNVSPKELIESVGSCSGGDLAEDIEIIDTSY
ncbi:unnamed protein product [Ilex paraguariensis]|uniref:Uncharacterized protein n=1 Tax=Ilex paraguariensis TaxID=185542 RepID=A0ABC8TBA4_9AQUA